MRRSSKAKLYCKYCGREFEVSPYRANTAIYCSRRCRSKDPDWRKKIRNLKNHHIVLICKHCGKEFKVSPCFVNQEHCSKKCAYADAKRGEKISRGILRLVDDSFRKKHSENTLKQWKTLRGKMVKALSQPEVKAKQSVSSFKRWQDEVFREKTIKAILQATRKRPTGIEEQIIDLTNEFQLPLKYVGSGQIVIGGKNPDFICTNGRKLLLETYNTFEIELGWKPKNYEKLRMKHFRKFGFQTIFLTERELEGNDWKEKCLAKIAEEEFEK